MALSDLTFKLYTDTGLSSLYSGTTTLVNKTDLSDNPQDFVVYFGSNTADRVLKAVSNPGVDQITITPTYAISDWVVAEALSLGDSRRPTTPNGKRFQVTTAGTTDATTEPTWPTTIGSTVADGTVVWTCVAAERTINEIKLATTSLGLGTAIAGAALDIGTSVSNGTANKKTIYVRVTNTITTVSSTVGEPEITLNINSVAEEVA